MAQPGYSMIAFSLVTFSVIFFLSPVVKKAGEKRWCLELLEAWSGLCASVNVYVPGPGLGIP